MENVNWQQLANAVKQQKELNAYIDAQKEIIRKLPKKALDNKFIDVRRSPKDFPKYDETYQAAMHLLKAQHLVECKTKQNYTITLTVK